VARIRSATYRWKGTQAALDLAAVVQALPHRRRGRGHKGLRDPLVQRRELAASGHAGWAVAAGRAERGAPLGGGPRRTLAPEARGLGIGDPLAHGVARVPQAAGDLAYPSTARQCTKISASSSTVILLRAMPSTSSRTRLAGRIQYGAGWVNTVTLIGKGGSIP
jgi:hypothetical protein